MGTEDLTVHSDEPASVANPELREALAIYVQYCLQAVIEVCGPDPQLERADEKWVRDGDTDQWRRKPVLEDHAFRLGYYSREDELDGSPEAQRCLALLNSDQTIAPQLGNLVGSASQLHRLESDDILKAVFFATIAEERRWDAERFDRAYSRTMGYLYANEVSQVTLAPLAGAALLAGIPIHLGPGLEIDLMSDDDVRRCLKSDLIRRFPSDSDITIVSAKWAIRREELVPEVIRTAGDLASEVQPTAEPVEVPETVLRALRLLKAGRIGLLGAVRFEESVFSSSMSWDAPPSRPPSRGDAYELLESEAEALVELWQMLEDDRVRQSHRLGNALRRFDFAADRSLEEDRLVDLMISAESLFLDRDVRAGIGYRLALRAAWYLDDPGRTPAQVMQMFRRAYGARSDVVHGDDVRPNRLASSAGSQVDLPAFVEEVEELTRWGLKQAVRDTITDRYPPAWDEVILPPR